MVTSRDDANVFAGCLDAWSRGEESLETQAAQFRVAEWINAQLKK